MLLPKMPQPRAVGCYHAMLERLLGRLTMAHRVYDAIVTAIRSGHVTEPFSKADLRNACPGFGAGTYQAFLDKHRVDNPGGNSELFARVKPGHFSCLRPFRYGL